MKFADDIRLSEDCTLILSGFHNRSDHIILNFAISRLHSRNSDQNMREFHLGIISSIGAIYFNRVFENMRQVKGSSCIKKRFLRDLLSILRLKPDEAMSDSVTRYLDILPNVWHIYEVCEASQIVQRCHPERRAKPAVEGPTHYRCAYKFVSA